jgi:streptogramin lyase
MKRSGILSTALTVLTVVLSLVHPASANTIDLYQPFGIAVTTNGTTYTANPFRHELDKFDVAGTRLASLGTFGSGEGAFRGCSGVAVDSRGAIYVADTGNSRIVRLSDQGTSLLWEGVILGPTAVDFPRDVFIDALDRLFVVDNTDTVKAFDLSGNPLGLYSEGRNFFGGSGTEPGKLNRPYGVFVDGSGSIYVADSYNHRIQKFDAGGNLVLAFGSAGTGPGEFLQPRDVVVNSEGRIYVADTNNHRIQEFDAQGRFIAKSDDGSLALTGVPSAETLAVDIQDQLRFTIAGGTGASETNTDHTPPEILVEGFSSNAAYVGVVTPIISVTDLNPRIEQITLNGEVFQSGTAVSAEGVYRLSVYAEDAFGNSATKELVFYIDHTAPEVRFSGAMNGLSYDRDVTVTFETRDNFDPAPTVQSSHASGVRFTESGSHTITVSATDWVGNRQTYTITFEIFKLPSLVAQVQASVVPEGLKNSLLSKLEQAILLMQGGQHKAATNVLGAFINAVRAQRGNKIPVSLADEWVRFAESMIRLIDSRWLNIVAGEVVIKKGATEVVSSEPAVLDSLLLGLGQKGISRLVLEAYTPDAAGSGVLYVSDGDLTGLGDSVRRDPEWGVNLGLLMERANNLGMKVSVGVRAFRTATGAALSPTDESHRFHLTTVVEHLLLTYPGLDGIVVTDLSFAGSEETANPTVLCSFAADLSGRVRAKQKRFFVSVPAVADDAAYAEVLNSAGLDYAVLSGLCDGLYLVSTFNQDANHDGWADNDPSWVGRAAAYVDSKIQAMSPNCAVIPQIQTFDTYEPFEDGDGDGTYDEGEVYMDLNGNGVWDKVVTTQPAQVGDAIDGISVENVAAIALDHLTETSVAEWDAFLNSHPR